MRRHDTGMVVKAFLASMAFMAAGLFTRWAEGPAVIGWTMILFGAAGAASVIFRIFKPAPPLNARGPQAGVVLRDGRDYRVDVTATGFTIVHKTSAETQAMAWADITFVGIMAIDNWPAGGISFVVHGAAANRIEVPWDVEGHQGFLDRLQRELPGFDNLAVVQAAGMIHGFKQAWPSDTANSHPAASVPQTG